MHYLIACLCVVIIVGDCHMIADVNHEDVPPRLHLMFDLAGFIAVAFILAPQHAKLQARTAIAAYFARKLAPTRHKAAQLALDCADLDAVFRIVGEDAVALNQRSCEAVIDAAEANKVGRARSHGWLKMLTLAATGAERDEVRARRKDRAA